MDYKPIEDYGIIGDLRTVALVGNDGSIDFMCIPHFDSPSVFTALLDHTRGGRFQISPTVGVERSKQFYLPNTCVLLTRFLSKDGVGELADFMPVEEAVRGRTVVRQVTTVRGELTYRMVCDPRFDYGRGAHRTVREVDGVTFHPTTTGAPALRLRTGCPVEVTDGAVRCEFTLSAGQQAWFVLEQLTSEPSPCKRPEYAIESFKNTVNFWRRWISRSTYRGRWRETVNRSAFVLKLLTSQDHGSIVAAPTFGLPEEIGGVRNWDYRYTWIRDASFTSYALTRLGLIDEAGRFFDWIKERCRETGRDSSLEIMYGLDGRRDLDEFTLDHLEGYRKSSPVRIGNAAHDQLQLDIYGALIDSIYVSVRHGYSVHHDLWREIARITDWVCKNWRFPDESIWEVRGGRREFLYSRVMCWVAIDRALRVAAQHSLPAPVAQWTAVRDEIYRDVFDELWDTKRGAFVQYKGSTAVDASALIMPLVRFISPSDPRWLSTLRVIEHDLIEDALVYRYRPGGSADDGLTGKEGTFSICTFWYVECLARAGDLDLARLCFEKMIAHANHVGLYAEQLGPCGEHLGNFPQALTHSALIGAATYLNRRLDAEEQAK
jgi:GH15 family glucan-1,4-alpha-glucosidase